MNGNVQIAKTKVGESLVSTIRFPEIWDDDGREIWFETLIFGGPHRDHEEWHSTLEEAQSRHAQIVEALKAGRSPTAT